VALEWDHAKSEANRKARGFGFEVANDFDWDFALGPEIQYVDGEEREFWIGPIGNDLYALVITERVDATRVISLRTVTKLEYREWRKRMNNETN